MQRTDVDFRVRGDDGGGVIGFGTGKIEADMVNTVVYPQTYGKAKYAGRGDRSEFSVEIEDVPIGTYGLTVGGASVGEIQAKKDPDGTVRGELEFRVPVKPGKILLDFDPHGQNIEVLDGATVILSVVFAMS